MAVDCFRKGRESCNGKSGCGQLLLLRLGGNSLVLRLITLRNSYHRRRKAGVKTKLNDELQGASIIRATEERQEDVLVPIRFGVGRPLIHEQCDVNWSIFEDTSDNLGCGSSGTGVRS